jgi:hypothetical protein
MPSGIRSLDMQIIDKIFQMEGGYVLDFSDRTMPIFFAEELNVDIDDPRYRDDGTSKARRLRCFLRKEDTNTAIRTLNALWQYRETRRALTGKDEWLPNAHAQLLNLLNRLQGKPSQPFAPQPFPPSPFEKPNYAGFLGELIALSKLTPQPRGFAFEGLLRRLFSAFGLLPRDGFRTVGEQIDGSFVLAGETYLLEAKWHNEQTPAADLHIFQGKLSKRVNWARGLFVSYSGFSRDGLTAYGRGGSVVCMDGLDLHDALQGEIPLNHVLEQKVRRSVETGEVLVRVRDLFPR